MKITVMLVAALAVMGAGCGGASAPEATAGAEGSEAAPAPAKDHRLESQTFEGFSIPGTAAQAKAAGLTSCEAKDNELQCQQVKPAALLGVPALAVKVTLDAKDNFRPMDDYGTAPPLAGKRVEDLTYRDVTFIIADAEYDEKCVEDYRRSRESEGYVTEPDECAKPGNIASLRVALAKAGWKTKGWRKRGEDFYRKGVPLVVAVWRDFDDSNQVTVRAVALAEVNEVLDDLEAKAKAAAEKAATGGDLVEAMKAGN